MSVYKQMAGQVVCPEAGWTCRVDCTDSVQMRGGDAPATPVAAPSWRNGGALRVERVSGFGGGVKLVFSVGSTAWGAG